MKNMEELELLPDPQRMIEGLRDTGYEFNTAMADIIDNSIAAKASQIFVSIAMDFRGKVIVTIADNGEGMNRDGLLNAMKYGSKQRPNAASLGKFGLGLKTASTAFCRKLSLVSRNNSKENPLMATWDLDHVVNVSRWELLLNNAEEQWVELLDKVAPKSSGTIVIWEKTDRLLKDYSVPDGAPARKALKQKIDDVTEHVSMVYQRFLDHKDKRAPNVSIFINEEPVMSWDPFCVESSELAANETQEVETPAGKTSNFNVKAYILPRKEEFANEELFKASRLSNSRQGFYIYRENRLIHSGDWLGMWTMEPHGTLLRVEFSFDNTLDDAFHIDIKKSQIILDQELWNWLKDQFLTAPRREANNRYRHGQNLQAKKKAAGSHETSNNNIASKENQIDATQITVLNKNTGDCEIQNKNGKFKFKLTLSEKLNPGEVYIQPVSSLNDNLLFQPALIEGHKAVQINTSHPYYHKVYVPNLAKGVIIQGMDSLLWAISTAELNCSNENTLKHFDEVKFEISRILRTLVEDLPEPDMKDEGDE